MTTSSRIGLFLGLVPLTLLHVGCGSDRPVPKDPGPSYAELVMIYNAELETLDRLERKRAELVAEYEKLQRPNPEETMKALSNAFQSALGAIPEGALGATGDPQAALDRAVESAEKAQDVVSQFFQAVKPPAGEPGTDAPAQPTPAAEEFQKQRAQLDQEIEQQRARVERARQARDAAER
jgi:hypothetical protein